MEPQRAAAARSENFIVRKLGSYDSVVQYSGEQAILIGGRVAASKVEGRVVVWCKILDLLYRSMDFRRGNKLQHGCCRLRHC